MTKTATIFKMHSTTHFLNLCHLLQTPQPPQQNTRTIVHSNSQPPQHYIHHQQTTQIYNLHPPNNTSMPPHSPPVPNTNINQKHQVSIVMRSFRYDVMLVILGLTSIFSHRYFKLIILEFNRILMFTNGIRRNDQNKIF